MVSHGKAAYGIHAELDRPPLAVGLFVEADIVGRIARDVFVLPLVALRPGNPMDPDAPDAVHVIDAENRLRIRPIEVLRTERELVVIGEGLAPGEQVSLSPLQAVVDGMRVRVVGAPEPEPPAAADGSS